MRCVHCKGKKLHLRVLFFFFFLVMELKFTVVKTCLHLQFYTFWTRVPEMQCKDRPPNLCFFYEPDHRSSCLKGFALQTPPPPTPQGTVPQRNALGLHHRAHGWGSDVFPVECPTFQTLKGSWTGFFSSSLLDLRQRSRRCGRLQCLMWMCLSVNTEEWLWLQTDVCELIRPH